MDVLKLITDQKNKVPAAAEESEEPEENRGESDSEEGRETSSLSVSDDYSYGSSEFSSSNESSWHEGVDENAGQMPGL